MILSRPSFQYYASCGGDVDAPGEAFLMQNLLNAQFTFLAPYLCKAHSDFPNIAMPQKNEGIMKLLPVVWFGRLKISSSGSQAGQVGHLQLQLQFNPLTHGRAAHAVPHLPFWIIRGTMLNFQPGLPHLLFLVTCQWESVKISYSWKLNRKDGTWHEFKCKFLFWTFIFQHALYTSSASSTGSSSVQTANRTSFPCGLPLSIIWGEFKFNPRSHLWVKKMKIAPEMNF